MLIQRNRSQLLVVDVQERLMPSIAQIRPVLSRIMLLIKAARRLDVPVVATEHWPENLGPLAVGVKKLIPDPHVFVKRHFAATKEPGFDRHVSGERAQVVICGTETHVCVLQTALGLLEAGMAPVVVADAVGSREPADKEAGLARMRDAGVVVATAESVVFEWLEKAGTPEFKDIIPLIK
jgi:nicotinamidase-related amidase